MKLTSTLALTAAAGLLLALGLGSAQANNLFGIDVSSYQGSINWASVHANGAQFAFAKATEGNYYQDAYFNANMVNGKAAGMQMGAVHFARPDVDCPSTEANYFWNFAGAYIIADGKSIYPAADFEIINGHACQASYTAWFNAWSTQLKAKTSHFLHPVLLCEACSGACDLTTSCGLSEWIISENGQNLFTGNPWGACDCCNWLNPCTVNGWSYWLVTSTGAIGGVSGNCDFDAFNGSLSTLKSTQGVK